MIYTQKAILLKKINSKEKDSILIFLSEDKGRVEAYSKSSRGVTKKSAKIDVLNLMKVTFAEGKNLEVLTECSVINSFNRIKENKDLCFFAFYLLEVTEKLTKINPIDSHLIYPTLLETLESLENLVEYKKRELLLCWYTIYLLNTFGFTISFDHLEELERKVSRYISEQELGNIFKIDLTKVNTKSLLNTITKYLEEQIGTKINSKKLIT